MEFKRNTSAERFSCTLAIVALLLANAAVADSPVPTDTLVATAAAVVDTNSSSRKRATSANNAAAAKAIESVLADTQLDLDIRLIGPTSVKIASDR